MRLKIIRLSKNLWILVSFALVMLLCCGGCPSSGTYFSALDADFKKSGVYPWYPRVGHRDGATIEIIGGQDRGDDFVWIRICFTVPCDSATYIPLQLAVRTSQGDNLCLIGIKASATKTGDLQDIVPNKPLVLVSGVTRKIESRWRPVIESHPSKSHKPISWYDRLVITMGSVNCAKAEQMIDLGQVTLGDTVKQGFR